MGAQSASLVLTSPQYYTKLGVMTHTCNPSIGGADRQWIQGNPWLHSDIPSQKQTKQCKQTNKKIQQQWVGLGEKQNWSYLFQRLSGSN